MSRNPFFGIIVHFRVDVYRKLILELIQHSRSAVIQIFKFGININPSIIIGKWQIVSRKGFRSRPSRLHKWSDLSAKAKNDTKFVDSNENMPMFFICALKMWTEKVLQVVAKNCRFANRYCEDCMRIWETIFCLQTFHYLWIPRLNLSIYK